jgi:hypothetical protein
MPRYYADPNPTYAPAMRLVSAITQATQAQVTTSFAHGYLSGLIVRILVPDLVFGMVQLDKQEGKITVIDDTNFTIDIDTTHYNAFTIPGTIPYYIESYPQVVPFAEINSSLAQAVRNIL